jgi:hypothetical protein
MTIVELASEILTCYSAKHRVGEYRRPCREVLDTPFECPRTAGSIDRRRNGEPRWSMPRRFGEMKEALSDVLAQCTETQTSVTEAFRSLWALERSIRQTIRTRAKTSWGPSWRQRVLSGDLPDKVLERAGVAAYAAAKSIREIRDPLEWLSLGELLDTRSSRPEIGDLGVEKAIALTHAPDEAERPRARHEMGKGHGAEAGRLDHSSFRSGGLGVQGRALGQVRF